MHLSRFEINSARRAARALLASPQAMHAAVLAGFPADSVNRASGERLLWRLDHNVNQTLLYVVSPRQPDFTHLVESAGWPSTQGWETRDYRPLLASLQAGDRWAFRIMANPTRHGRKSPEATDTQRFGHLTATQQQEWLVRRSARSGFAVPVNENGEPEVLVRRRQTLRFSRHGRTVTLTTAVFDGCLQVIDPDALVAALTQGIGPAKGYGCGLLTLARVS